LSELHSFATKKQLSRTVLVLPFLGGARGGTEIITFLFALHNLLWSGKKKKKGERR
jgi:hypothetical protein